jgi:hypothetical protein
VFAPREASPPVRVSGAHFNRAARRVFREPAGAILEKTGVSARRRGKFPNRAGKISRFSRFEAGFRPGAFFESAEKTSQRFNINNKYLFGTSLAESLALGKITKTKIFRRRSQVKVRRFPVD